MHQHCANELLGTVTSMPLCRSSFSFMVHCLGRRQWHPGWQPWQMEATESTEQDISPFSSLTPTSKSISTMHNAGSCGCCRFPHQPFYFSFHFLPLPISWRNMDTDGWFLPWKSYMCWQHSCRTRLSWFHRADFKAAAHRVVQYTVNPLIYL